MGKAEKMDCRANGEVDFNVTRPLGSEFSELSLPIIHPRLVSGKRNGVPFQLFSQNNFKEVPHAAGNDYKDTSSF
jgi:hypothetical protein